MGIQQTIFMRKTILPYSMNKRGQAEIIGVILLLGVIIVGIYGTLNSISENRYIADTDSGIIYDLTKCSIKNLENEDLIVVRDLDVFIKETNYTMARCKK
jgi:flagellin-like protein